MQALMPPRTANSQSAPPPPAPTAALQTNGRRASADPRPGAAERPPLSVPEQSRPRAGQRDHARGARSLHHAAGGAHARGSIPGRLALFGRCLVMSLSSWDGRHHFLDLARDGWTCMAWQAFSHGLKAWWILPTPTTHQFSTDIKDCEYHITTSLNENPVCAAAAD